MKQYRITSLDFTLPGESGDPDAYMSPEDLEQLKSAAGVTGLLNPAIVHAHAVMQQIAQPKIIRERKYDGS